MDTDLVRVLRTTQPNVRSAVVLLRAQLRDYGIRVRRGQVEQGVAAALSLGTPSVIVLARQRRRAVGVCLFHLLPSVEWGGRSVWVEELYVTRRARRTGVATSLMRAVARLGIKAGARAADLEVSPSQAAALEFSRRAGFRCLVRTRLTWQLPVGERQGLKTHAKRGDRAPRRRPS